MGLFSRKQTDDLVEFCEDFYNTRIVDPSISEPQWQAVMRSIAEVDSSFDVANANRFGKEMTLRQVNVA